MCGQILLFALAGVTPEHERDRLRQKPRIGWIGISPSASCPARALFDETRKARASLDEGVGVGSDERNVGIF